MGGGRGWRGREQTRCIMGNVQNANKYGGGPGQFEAPKIMLLLFLVLMAK